MIHDALQLHFLPVCILFYFGLPSLTSPIISLLCYYIRQKINEAFGVGVMRHNKKGKWEN